MNPSTATQIQFIENVKDLIGELGNIHKHLPASNNRTELDGLIMMFKNNIPLKSIILHIKEKSESDIKSSSFWKFILSVIVSYIPKKG